SVTAVAVKDEKGKVKYYDGIIEDITERKRGREALKKSEEKYKFLIDHINDITVVVDKNGKFQFANKKAVETMGYSMEEIIGMSFSEIVLEEYAPILFDALKQEFEGKPVPAMEIKIKTKEGDIKILGMAEGSAPIYENGEVVGIQITARDITERKKVEEEIRQLKEFNEGIIQSMAEGIVVENAEGYFIFVNPAAADLLGYSPSELLGQHWTVIVPSGQQLIVQAADERRARGETDHYELELVRKDGRQLFVLVSGSPRFEEGRFAGTLAVFTDITERKHFEEQREQARKEAEFYADVLAHDVSNIDQITLGYLYLLKNAKDEKTRKKNINNIKKSIMKSARLADNIKTLKKIKDTKLEKFDLNKSIGRSVEKIKAYVDREIQVNLNIDKKYHVNANDFLDKVFFNILENAVEFTLQDSVVIDIKTEEKKGMCNIHIRDRGIG
ncbi:MAG: PAS domain S-box protein, partial [Methanomicrobia archaeon]|nr:PAS domain S-box protein [Methanomicrobia archaeon]